MTTQKYITMKLDDVEVIFTFPRTVDHDRMHEAIGIIRFGFGRHWDRKLHGVPALSAGFITNGVCHGRSETLNLESRGALDTALLTGNTQ